MFANHEYVMEFTGVSGSDRTEKVKTVRLATAPKMAPLDDAEVINLGVAALISLRVKRGVWRIDRNPSDPQSSRFIFSGWI